MTTENTQHWGPFGPPQPALRTLQIDGWRIRPSHEGTVLLFVLPGFTHFICGVN